MPVVTPAQQPNPATDDDWGFPDHEQGIVAAVKAGATCLWANTILFFSKTIRYKHPLPHFPQVYACSRPRFLSKLTPDVLEMGRDPPLHCLIST